MSVQRVGNETAVDVAAPLPLAQVPNITKLSDGRFVVWWASTVAVEGSADQYDLRARIYGTDGLPQGADFQINADLGAFPDARIAALSSGGFVASWGSYEDSVLVTNAQVFGADGTPQGPDFTAVPYDSSALFVTGLGDGGFVLTWLTYVPGSGYEARGNVRASDGTAIGPAFSLSAVPGGNQSGSRAVVLSDGRFIVSWDQSVDGAAPLSEAAMRVFAADGTPLGPDILVGSLADHFSYSTRIAELPNGNLAVAWYHADPNGVFGVFVRLYDATGAELTAPIPVHATPAEYFDPTILALSNGQFVVAWSSLVEGAADIRARVFSASGEAVTSEILVSTLAGDHYVPQLIELSSGGFLVSWEGPVSETDYDSYARAFASDGSPLGSDFRLNIAAPGQQIAPRVTALDGGQFAAVWWDLDEAAASDVRLQIFDAAAQNLAPVIGSGGGGNAAAYSVIENSTDVAVIAATDIDLNQRPTFSIAGGADASRFDINAETGALRFIAGPDFEGPNDIGGDNVYEVTVQASDGEGGVDTQDIAVTVENIVPGPDTRVNTTTVGTQYLSSVAALADGGFVITWTTQNVPRDVFAQRFDATGEARGGEVLFAAATGANVVGLSGGGYVVVLMGLPGGLRGELFDANGVLAGTIPISPTTGTAWPSLAALDDGGFIVTWRSSGLEGSGQDGSGQGVFARRFDAQGTAIEDEFQVNTFTEGPQQDAAVAVFPDGGFVITWTSLDQDGSGRGIYGQRYDSSAAPIGPEFIINTQTENNQQQPSVAVLSDGGFVVTWTNASTEILDESVHGQRFDAAGLMLGAEFQVQPAPSPSFQRYSTVVATPDGGFVVSWTSRDDDQSAYAYYGRRFDANGVAQGEQFSLSATTLGDQRHEADRSGHGIAVLASGDLVATWHGDPVVPDPDGPGQDEIFMRIISLGDPPNGAPTLPPDNTVALDEDEASASTAIGASDPDGDALTYTLKSGYGPSKGAVQISGDAFVYAPMANANGADSFTIVVGDGNGGLAEQVVAVSIVPVNDAPTDLAISATSIAENAAAGTVIGLLSVVDVDAGDSHVFSLSDDAGGRFVIVNNELVLAAGAGLDFETAPSHEITIEVTDSGGLTHSEVVTIDVVNATEAPTDILVAGGTVVENAAAGTLVATLSAVDADLGDTFTYAIIAGGAGLFEIVGDQIRVAAGAQVDFETATSHDLTLRVTDGAGAFYEEVVTIGVSNVAPVIIGTNAANTLNGTSEEDEIFGRNGNDTLSGLAGADKLFGEAGNDRLLGGAGADVLDGGVGNDTYLLADAGDVSLDTVVELAGGGVDTVEAGADYMLAANVENLILIGTGNLSGTGNDADNSIVGTIGNNVIDGGLGNDTMTGGQGDDTYYVDSSADRVVESAGAGNDEIRSKLNVFGLAGLGNVERLSFVGTGNFTGTGNGLANVITGGDGADTLDGAGGADTMAGAANDDTYIVNNAGDLVVEGDGEGIDTVRSSVAYSLGDFVENLVLTAGGSLNATGNGLDNALTGGAGNNQLDGGLGADTMAGLAGNDSYVVDSLDDVVVEAAGQGTDTVLTALAEFGIGAFDNVENLTFTGTGNFTGQGNGLDNVLTGAAGNDALAGGDGADTLVGNGGADTLDGGLGSDTLRGGDGNDTYHVDAAGDRAIETSNQGIDTVLAAVNHTLGSNVENLTLVGTATTGNGNGLANTITGNDLNNTLGGAAGNDALHGGDGNDTLTGGSGDDILVGGAGTDTMTGGTNADRFVFLSPGDSPSGAGMDIITDFQDSGADTIDLAAIFDGTLSYRHALAFDGIGQVRINDILGPNVLVQVNLDADISTSELDIQLTGTTLAAMGAGDFIL
ncbi:cadherin domain-containing protein [Devosia sp.]|uniref:beta strand repeat-containing protein n=1 Tax=Devosia sp. TaxID=1871048 RepID=UPI0025DD803D|nr:cadherin domain-containing protein [Devosia sp.]MCR6636386.1 cadherin domain-containing protein [Devosia sp.]